jgi:SagB-type dehydrogenase family enzyme
MNNDNTQLAWQYHDLTKHSYSSIRASPHFLDFANMPLPFKIYPDLEPLPLPQVMPAVNKGALEAITGDHGGHGARPDLGLLASVLYYSAGITRKKSYPGGTIYFRAAACAGALYPIETYVVCRDIEGLEAGVYHFNPGDFALRRLRGGDLRSVLVGAAAGQTNVSAAPVTLVYTAISWRSSWKYRDRAYRYHYWDLGMVLANAIAVARGHDIVARVVMGFVDAEINRLLGIDGARELALALLPLGGGDSVSPANQEIAPLEIVTVPLSDSEVDYPSIRQAHAASSLTSREEVAKWRSGASVHTRQLDRPGSDEDDLSPMPGNTSLTPMAGEAESNRSRDSLEQVILRRGSTRRFTRKAMSLADLSTILERATGAFPSDFTAGEDHLNKLYLIVNRVDGLDPGSYIYQRRDRGLELLKTGDFSDRATYLALDQSLAGDASVTVFFMADLDKVFGRYGNRGYRLAQLEAGLTGGRLYIASYAIKRGATGLTFYDDDVTDFFSPHAANLSCIFVMALGIPGKKPLF